MSFVVGVRIIIRDSIVVTVSFVIFFFVRMGGVVLRGYLVLYVIVY